MIVSKSEEKINIILIDELGFFDGINDCFTIKSKYRVIA